MSFLKKEIRKKSAKRQKEKRKIKVATEQL
jgi:hypothetical protein